MTIQALQYKFLYKNPVIRIGLRTALVMMVFSLNLNAQENLSESIPGNSISLDDFQQMVMDQNLVLKAARERLTASELGAKTGIAPANPEVEFGYMKGSPDLIGNKMNVRVAQSFEFPTTYIHKRELRDVQTDEAGLIYEITRQEVLNRAGKLYIERIYLNKSLILLKSRMTQAEELVEHYEKMVKAGETNRLELSQVKLQVVALKTDLSGTMSDIESSDQALTAMVGGGKVKLNDTIFPESRLPDSTAVFEAYQSGPEMKLYENNLLKSRAASQVTKSESLPEFTTGYYSEVLTQEAFRGVFLGMSIPLWEDANKVKRSKAEIVSAEAEKLSFELEQMSRVRKQVEQYARLQQQLGDLNEALEEVDGMKLLEKALDAGEISLSEYILTSEYYFQNLIRLYENQRDLLMMETEIMKVFL